MIDPLYIALALIAAALGWPGMDVMAALLGAALIVAVIFVLWIVVPMLLWLLWAQAFGGPRRAPFLKLRWVQHRSGERALRKRRAAARRLIDTYGLDLRSDPPGPQPQLQQLVADAVTADASVPALVGGSLDIDALGRSLSEVSGGGAERQADLALTLARLIPMRRPVPPWRAASLTLRRALSPLILRRVDQQYVQTHVASQMVALLGHLNEGARPVTRAGLLGSWVMQARLRAGLPLLPEQTETLASDLPLPEQRSLQLLTRVLRGVPIWRLIAQFPTRHRQIRAFAKLVAALGDAPAAPQVTPKQAPPPAFSADQLARLLDTHRQTALLLRRVWPMAPSEVRSRLGGLPDLPEGAEWPLGDTGTPMAFLAQIDCAELPQPPGQPALPREGALSFFADCASRRAAVIYAPSNAPCAPRPVPEAATAYDAWPVTAVCVETWGTGSGPVSNPSYRDAARAAHRDAIAARLPKGAGGATPLTLEEADVIRLHPDLARTGWPWCGAALSGFFAALRAEAARAETPQRAVLLANCDKGAARFDTIAPYDPVSAELAQGLCKWINGGMRAGGQVALGAAIRQSAHGVLRACLDDRQMRRVIPAAAVQMFAPDLMQSPNGGQHLMLGTTRPGTGDTGDAVRLLCLVSDPGMGFAFAGGGIEFWITPEDLSARDFTRVWAEATRG